MHVYWFWGQRYSKQAKHLYGLREKKQGNTSMAQERHIIERVEILGHIYMDWKMGSIGILSNKLILYRFPFHIGILPNMKCILCAKVLCTNCVL